MGSVTTDISPWTLLVPILITGFGVGFIFVPISTQAYGTLPKEQIGAASGLYNLMRNIGGSIGVSLSATLLTRRSSVHQSEMTNYSPLSGQQFQSALQTQMGALGTHFGPEHTRYPAELQLYSQLLYQATDWAFVDVFRWLALLSLSGAVIVWLFKRVQKGRPPAGAGAH
jgi:DHA2 family multidrug resistance protein